MRHPDALLDVTDLFPRNVASGRTSLKAPTSSSTERLGLRWSLLGPHYRTLTTGSRARSLQMCSCCRPNLSEWQSLAWSFQFRCLFLRARKISPLPRRSPKVSKMPSPRIAITQVTAGFRKSCGLLGEDTFHQHNVGVTFGECSEDGPAVRGPGNAAGDDRAALAEVGNLAQGSSLCGQ